MIYTWFFVIILVIIDHITKYIALTKLKPVGTLPLIDGFLNFVFVENRGAAFGILQGQTLFFAVATTIVCFFIVKEYKKYKRIYQTPILTIAVILVLAGAIGNFIDRVFRGYVVDFFNFMFISFPVFNMADVYVCCGVALLMYFMIFIMREEF